VLELSSVAGMGIQIDKHRIKILLGCAGGGWAGGWVTQTFHGQQAQPPAAIQKHMSKLKRSCKRFNIKLHHDSSLPYRPYDSGSHDFC
jgi:hypothetical protein